jgi:hypothetical protein
MVWRGPAGGSPSAAALGGGETDAGQGADRNP